MTNEEFLKAKKLVEDIEKLEGIKSKLEYSKYKEVQFVLVKYLFEFDSFYVPDCLHKDILQFIEDLAAFELLAKKDELETFKS